MTSCILHIGAGKCGSSALQSALSNTPVIRQPGQQRKRPFRYCAILKDGTLSQGIKLKLNAANSPTGAISTVRPALLAEFSDAQVGSLRSSLARLGRKSEKLILSKEGFFEQAALFQETRLLEKLDLQCEVIVYVRPQPAWLNSAWWQWGAWTGAPFRRWLKQARAKCQWTVPIKQWGEVPGVTSVHVRLLEGDVVGDFCQATGIPQIASDNHNVSLPGSVLRLYQRHQQRLRPGPHESDIDFALGRYLNPPNDKTPWILAPRVTEQVLEFSRPSNLELLQLLDPPSRSKMEADARWWDAAAYQDRQHQRPGPLRAADPAVDELAVELIEAVSAFDREKRRWGHVFSAASRLERVIPWRKR